MASGIAAGGFCLANQCTIHISDANLAICLPSTVYSDDRAILVQPHREIMLGPATDERRPKRPSSFPARPFSAPSTSMPPPTEGQLTKAAGATNDRRAAQCGFDRGPRVPTGRACQLQPGHSKSGYRRVTEHVLRVLRGGPGAVRAAAKHARLALSPSPNGWAHGSIAPRQMRYPGKHASICQFLLPAIRGRIAPAIF